MSSASWSIESFAAYLENHIIEVTEINTGIGELIPDEGSFRELALKSKDLNFSRTAAEETFYTEHLAKRVALEARLRAENVSWNKALPSAPATGPTDEDGRALSLSSTTPAEWNKHRMTSIGARRLMTALLKGQFVEPNGNLDLEGMRSAVRALASATKFDTIFSDGQEYTIKLGDPQPAYVVSKTIMMQLPDLAFFKPKPYKMWVLADELDDDETSILDFVSVSKVEDYENIIVIRQAVETLVAWLCLTFGEHMRGSLGRDLLELVNNAHLADVARDHLLFIPMVLTRVIGTLWSLLRSTIEDAQGLREELCGGAWVLRWRVFADRVMKVSHDKVKTFADKFERKYKAQLAKRLTRSRKSEESDSDSEPLAKRVASASGVVGSSFCFNALATYVNFGGVRGCKRPHCGLSHDFTGRKQADVSKAIKNCNLPFVRSVKADFIAATEQSGLF